MNDSVGSASVIAGLETLVTRRFFVLDRKWMSVFSAVDHFSVLSDLPRLLFSLFSFIINQINKQPLRCNAW